MINVKCVMTLRDFRAMKYIVNEWKSKFEQG